MKRKTRRILFYISVAVFLILSLIIVLYALGYRYDFIKNRFLKTGSFAIKTDINADFYINEIFAGSSSFLSRDFSKSRLLPRTYDIRAQADNYRPWEKLVPVEAGAFTDFPRVVLVPEKFKEEIVATSSLGGVFTTKFNPQDDTAIVSNKKRTELIHLDSSKKEFLKSPQPAAMPASTPEITPVNGGSSFLKSPDGNVYAWFNDHEVWIKWVKDSGYQPFKSAGDTELVTRFSGKIEDAQWFKDSAHLFVSVGGILKFVEIDNRGGINIFDITLLGGPFYYDGDTDSIYKFSGNQLVKIVFK